MPPAIRTIGQPTGDALEDARRLERSTWWAVVEARATLAVIPLSDAAVLEFARQRARVTQNKWADALRELDALQFPRRPAAGIPTGEARG